VICIVGRKQAVSVTQAAWLKWKINTPWCNPMPIESDDQHLSRSSQNGLTFPLWYHRLVLSLIQGSHEISEVCLLVDGWGRSKVQSRRITNKTKRKREEKKKKKKRIRKVQKLMERSLNPIITLAIDAYPIVQWGSFSNSHCASKTMKHRCLRQIKKSDKTPFKTNITPKNLKKNSDNLIKYYHENT